MFLSNPRVAVVSICALAVLNLSCGGSRATVNAALPRREPTTAAFPFTQSEPDVYQGEAVLNSNNSEERFYLARKGPRWRYDTYRDGKPEFSYVKNDKVFVVDHIAKTFREEPAGSDPLMPNLAGDVMRGPLAGRDHLKFEEVETDGSIVKYRAISDDGRGDTFIYFDNSLKLITKEEFPAVAGHSDTVYELRNIRRDVDDNVFSIPAGYRAAPVK